MLLSNDRDQNRGLTWMTHKVELAMELKVEVNPHIILIFSLLIKFLKLVSGGKSHLRKTTSKKPLEPSTIEYFQQSKIWKMENEFYEFANKVFQTAKKRALTPKHGVLEPVGKQFFYEKIRPKVPN